MEETLLEGAMQYGMNSVFGKFYMLRISNKEGVRGEKLTVVTCYINSHQKEDKSGLISNEI